MATLNISILEAALSEGKIDGNLSEAQKLYFHPSVVTANEIFEIIKQWEEADISQIAGRIRMSQNTIFEFTRWLQSAKLIIIIPNAERAIDGRAIKNLYTLQK